MPKKEIFGVVKEIGTFGSMNIEDPTIIEMEQEETDEELIKRIHKQNLENSNLL